MCIEEFGIILRARSLAWSLYEQVKRVKLAKERKIVMRNKLLMGLMVIALLGVAGWSQFPQTESAQDVTPQEIVADFYNWYLEYVNAGRGDIAEMRNPLVDGAYRTCGYLTGTFIQEIDETLASFDKGGFDPLLLAQDIPESVEAGETVMVGDEASVVIQMFWSGNPTPTERTVTVKQVDGQWKIADITF